MILGLVKEKEMRAKFLDHVKQLYFFEEELSLSMQLISGFSGPGCTNLGLRVTWATNLCREAPNTCGPSVWNLFHGAWNFGAPSRFLENMCTPRQGDACSPSNLALMLVFSFLSFSSLFPNLFAVHPSSRNALCWLDCLEETDCLTDKWR